MSKDIFDNDLQPFDVVAYTVPYYKSLKLGIVVKLTPCGATIQTEPDRDGDTKKINRASNQLALKSRMVACDGKCDK